MTTWRRCVLGAIMLLTAGCATFQQNPPMSKVDFATGYRFENLERPRRNSEETFVVLTLSGGGTRAAALAYGVMQKLHDTLIAGGRKALLDEVDVISSVSGGSFAAAYYGLFGPDRFFSEFHHAVLNRKIQRSLILRVLSPWNWPRLLSPRFGRSDLLNEYYDRQIFEGRTYADLSPQLPFVILNASDMSTGAQFPFTQESFDRLCSDLSKVHISRGVTSSSAFPGAFTPLTFKNYPKAQCRYQAPLWVDLALGDDPDCRAAPDCLGDLEDNPRRYDRARNWRSYEDAETRPYIHLIDGGGGGQHRPERPHLCDDDQ